MTDQKVKAYIAKQPKHHQEIIEKLRKLIFKTFPGIEEGFAWGVPIYDGGRFYIAGLKKQVNMGFSIVGLSKEKIALFEGSGKTARHIKIREYTPEIEKQLVPLLKLVKEKAGVPE